MTQLAILRNQLGLVPESDAVLQFYLDDASNIICDLRNSNIVEKKYLTTQVKIAIEMYNKRGAEGQVGHGENGISRSYEKADISSSLINQITPIVKTPYSVVRVITE